MNSVSSETGSGFEATRWSTVANAAAGKPPTRALGTLCTDYAYSVYAYLRASGLEPETAAAILQRFLGDTVAQFRSDVAAAAGGHFRRFLLERLGAFLARDSRGAHDDAPSASSLADHDFETRYLRDRTHESAPPALFERAFALEVLSRTLRRLAREAGERGHADMYAALAPFLVRDPAADDTERVARELRMRPLAISIALKRLRQRFGEIADEELADVVTDANALAAERITLLALLRQRA